MNRSPTRAPLSVLKNNEDLRCRMAFFRILSQILLSRGSAGDLQEQRQLVPVVGHVGDGLTEAGVGFDEFVIDLCVHPRVQFVHQRGAVSLVEHQALLGAERVFLRDGVIFVDFA